MADVLTGLCQGLCQTQRHRALFEDTKPMSLRAKREVLCEVYRYCRVTARARLTGQQLNDGSRPRCYTRVKVSSATPALANGASSVSYILI